MFAALQAFANTEATHTRVQPRWIPSAAGSLDATENQRMRRDMATKHNECLINYVISSGNCVETLYLGSFFVFFCPISNTLLNPHNEAQEHSERFKHVSWPASKASASEKWFVLRYGIRADPRVKKHDIFTGTHKLKIRILFRSCVFRLYWFEENFNSSTQTLGLIKDEEKNVVYFPLLCFHVHIHVNCTHCMPRYVYDVNITLHLLLQGPFGCVHSSLCHFLLGTMNWTGRVCPSH